MLSRPSTNGALPANVNLAVPPMVAQGRLAGNTLQGGAPNGIGPGSPAVNNPRAQSLIQNNQRMERLAALHGQAGNSQEMQRLMQQMQQNGAMMQQFRSSQQQLQGQMRGSPNMNNFGNMGNESSQSPSMVQQNGGSTTTSPNLGPQYQVPAMQNSQAPGSNHAHSSSLPQSLSSGHIPMVANLQAQIARSNPQMSPAEVAKMSTDQLRQMLVTQQSLATQQSRQNAISAATGLNHAGNHPGLPNASHQSPFPQQRHPSQPPNAGSPQLHANSPYMNASMLNSNHQPTTGRPSTATSNGVDPAAAQQRYSQEMMNRMMSQQRQQQLGIATAAAAGMHSPAMGNANAMPGMNGFGGGQRTPGQAMRPPSRSVGLGMDGQQMPRPGSSQSPRPLSASGFTG